jgi:hypothetical protein
VKDIMVNSQIFDEKLKYEVKATLLQTIISGLETNALTLTDMKESANYILDHIEKNKNYSQFIVFMDELKSKWPIFKNSYNLYSNKFYQEKENAVINKLQGFIKSQK